MTDMQYRVNELLRRPPPWAMDAAEQVLTKLGRWDGNISRQFDREDVARILDAVVPRARRPTGKQANALWYNPYREAIKVACDTCQSPTGKVCIKGTNGGQFNEWNQKRVPHKSRHRKAVAKFRKVGTVGRAPKRS